MDIVKKILSLFFPQHCPYCREIIPYGSIECRRCAERFPKASVFSVLPDGSRCVSPFEYTDEYRRAILDMKFKGAAFNAESLGKAIARSAREHYDVSSIDYVIAVPMSRDRLKQRGYNQSELLAKKAADELSLPYEEILTRKPGALIQHELTYEQRLVNKDMRFMVTSPELAEGKRILLVDDIVTTGMTLVNCRTLLTDSKADEILCVTAAATIKK